MREPGRALPHRGNCALPAELKRYKLRELHSFRAGVADRDATGEGEPGGVDQERKTAFTTAAHHSSSSASRGGGPPIVAARGRGTRMCLATSLTTAPG